MPDHIDDLVAKLRSLSPERQAKLVAEFCEIASIVANFEASDEDGSRSIGFSFSMTRSRGATQSE